MRSISKADVIREFAGKPFSEFKPALADLCVEKIGPINARMRELLAERGEIDRILATGAEKARQIATPVLEETMKIMGFWRTF